MIYVSWCLSKKKLKGLRCDVYCSNELAHTVGWLMSFGASGNIEWKGGGELS